VMNRVLVIGDSCRDVFVYGKCVRMCPDAPVPIFLPTERRNNGGMASNVVANIQKLGIECHLLCNTETIEKTRYVDEKTNHMFLRVDSGEENIERISGLTQELLSEYELIVISDYDKGFLHEEDIAFVCTHHQNVFVDTKKILGPWRAKAKFIKINEAEYNRTKHTVDSTDNMIITLGDNGCEYQGENFPVEKVEVKDMSGAGDTFLAGLVVKYLQTTNIRDAIAFANDCSTNVVQRRGVNVV
jgi:bifunctional ADP-heptose synthase (sugar kinase/adenylyltransferase)